jgi:hypothetical protein
MQQAFSYDFFAQRLKRISLEKAITADSPILNEAMQLIRAEMLAAPYLTRLESRAQAEVTRMQRFEVFALKSSLPNFIQDCQTTQTSITKLDLGSQEKQKTLNQASKICTDVEQRFQKSFAIYSDLDLVEMHNKSRIKAYQRYCNKPEKSIRCDIYERMAKINRQVLSQYRNESLAAVEQAWIIFEESIP